PDDFIYDTLKTKAIPIHTPGKKYDPVMVIDRNESIEVFFHSMLSFFAGSKEPDPSLLELKFRELILTIAENPRNEELLSYFSSMLHEPQSVAMQKVMEDNYCFNLKLEQ